MANLTQAFQAIGADIKSILADLLSIEKVIYINSGTGVWPARVVRSGYTGRVTWNSLTVLNATPPAGALDGDIWIRRVS